MKKLTLSIFIALLSVTVFSQTWEESDYWTTDTYTVISKSQFDATIGDGEGRYPWIGILYIPPYTTLPRNQLRLREPFYLRHTWRGNNNPLDTGNVAPKYQVSLYYVGTNGGVHVVFSNAKNTPSMWFRTNSWSKKYLELFIVKSDGTDRNIDEKIGKLSKELYEKGQLSN